MCNAWNHSEGCTCGWGGEGHLGRRDSFETNTIYSYYHSIDDSYDFRPLKHLNFKKHLKPIGFLRKKNKHEHEVFYKKELILFYQTLGATKSGSYWINEDIAYLRELKLNGKPPKIILLLFQLLPDLFILEPLNQALYLKHNLEKWAGYFFKVNRSEMLVEFRMKKSTTSDTFSLHLIDEIMGHIKKYT